MIHALLPIERHAVPLLVVILEEVVVVMEMAVAAADKADVTVTVVGEVEEMVLDTVKEKPSPNINKVTCLIYGKAYVACKDCGWNDGRIAHITGACEVAGKKGYQKLHLLATAMQAVVLDDNDDKEKTSTKKARSSTKMKVITAMMEQCEAMEKEEDNPDQANSAGMIGVFTKSMMKSKKE